MSFFNSVIQQTLRQIFNENELSIEVNVDYISVNSSKNQTEDKIRTIIEAKCFCPFIAQGSDGNFVFTLVPYKLPDFFYKQMAEKLLPTSLSEQVKLTYKTVNENLLSHENQITQGMSDEGYSAHFERNKRNILSLAAGVNGEALLLGFGNGHDTPLAELAAQFDQITVIDVDMFGVNKSINALPSHLQNKVTSIQKDLTGIIPLISEKIEQFNSEMSEFECINRIAQIIIEGTNSRELLSASKKYQFVVSSMLTSQLFSEIHRYVMDVLANKYPTIRGKEFSVPHFSTAINQLTVQVCQSHLDHLAAWTHSSGKIYYADTTHVDTMEAEFGWGPRGLAVRTKATKTSQVLPNEEISRKIDTLFSPIRAIDTWKWNTQGVQIGMGSKTPTMLNPGNRMNVVAHFLQPK